MSIPSAQLCPICGRLVCESVRCQECRLLKYDDHDENDDIMFNYCVSLTGYKQRACKCTKYEIKQYYKRKEADFIRLTHQIDNILKIKKR